MSPLCPACGGELIAGVFDWHYECRACGYEGTNLKPQINEKFASVEVDELARENGLLALRKRNFWKISSRLRSLFADRPPSSKLMLLDVGCAHGWFLEANRDRFEVFGIEPDSVVADVTLQHGLSLRVGFFPDVLEAHERFDVIAFNDVLEHIPDV